MDTPELQNIKKMYENVGYFDQYGGSVILFILVSIVLFLLISYCYIMINAQPIIDDWANQRCKPGVIPFAGLLTHPEGMTASEYTKKNFNYCTQNILSSISSYAVQPLTFTTNMLSNSANQISTDLQSVRGMFDKVRNMIASITQEIMGRLMNIMIPLQEIIIGFKDLIGKIQGTMTAGLFTMLGSYFALKSLLGAIAQFIITILITLAVMIAAFWAVPFTWGAAISSTAIFVAIAIPMAVILAFMVDVLKVQTNLKVPKVKCFDKDTLIEMNNGEKKKIIDIKIGDILANNNKVTSTMKVKREGSSMYILGVSGIIVSDSHLIKYNGDWIRVFKHPCAEKLGVYNEPYLYCLNTSNKNIVIDGYEFSDWDEIESIDDLDCNYGKKKIEIHSLKDIHRKLDGGFVGTTLFKLYDGTSKEIKDLNVGDILEGGNSIYGIVKIDGLDVDQFKYNLGDCFKFEGGPNLIIGIGDGHNKCFSTLSLESCKKWFCKERYLYHLLTENNLVEINGTTFYDYNASVNFFIQNKNE